MPLIRFPTTALPLLPLCKGHGTEFIFRTYADLIGFIAAYGFHLVSNTGYQLPSKPHFADNPNAIGLDVFENRGLYANFIMTSLAHDESRQIAEDEDLLAKLIERYADAGASDLRTRLSGIDQIQWPISLANLLSAIPEDTSKI